MGSHVDVAVFICLLLSVAHILRSIDLIELTLAVTHLPHVWRDLVLVLAQIRANQRLVHMAIVPVEHLTINIADTEDRCELPADGHASEVGHSEHSFD